ncbi:MAG: YggS family pyridoxal phosphate-dependent enzyme [Hyphomicrobiaceae bacterium]|nr:YggS family pyridoxal phosphate-dependent enzyme [Hyphomicrobiaceae bacterium]
MAATGAPTRLATVLRNVEIAATAAKRDPAAVNLIAVSKTFDAHDIRPVLAAGHRHFGENRVQEAQGKWPALRTEFPDVTLHLIGPLQSNKAADAVALFDVIHTIDRPKIATAIAAEIAKQHRKVPVFIQVNTGKEPQKAGIMPEDATAFVKHCRDVERLDVIGLMCIPPIDEEAAIHFAFLAKLTRELGLPRISMGMSSDYQTAISFGATDVRIGSAIFGDRG